MDGEDASNSIVGGVGFYNHRSVRDPMGQDRSGGESLLKLAEGGATGVTEVPRSTFAGETGQRSDEVGVIVYESVVEVCKTQKGLNVLDLTRLRPVLNCLDLLRGHGEPGGRELVAEVLSGVGGPFTFLGFGIKSVLAESTEDVSDMLLVGGLVCGVDKNVVQIDYNANI